MNKPSGPTQYQGDATLDRLLKDAGSPYDVAGISALLSGVEAAPDGIDPAAWTDLVAAAPGDLLRSQLLALRALRRDGDGRSTGKASSPVKGELAGRLAALRKELAGRRLAGFIVPRADEHQGEYVPPRAERLAWLTGFTGSAGVAVVLADAAALFVDGRYTLQAPAQIDGACFEVRHLIEQPPEKWLAARLGRGDRLGFDPWLHTVDGVARLKAALEPVGAELAACAENPLDAVWTAQPPPPLAPIRPLELRFTGRESADKRQAIGAAVAAAGAAAAVLTQPDSLAWLLNIRGGDVPHTPLPLGFATIDREGKV